MAANAANASGRRGAAFTLRTIGRSTSRRFECCATYQNFVFLGTSSGVDFNVVRVSPVDGDWELGSVGTIAAAKPVTQIAVLAELRVLLLLSDGQLFIHSFDPSGEPNRNMLSAQPTGTVRNVRDCVNFALKKDEGIYTLAAALRSRRIAVCVWRQNTFDMSKDLQSPEIPKSMLWYGKRLMLCCASNAKEYVAIDIENGRVATLIDTKQTALACYINGFRENLVVTQEALGLRLTESGGTSKKVIRWSHPPKSMIYVHPYLLSLHSALIEVHFPHVINGKTYCQAFNLANLETFSSVSYIDYDAPSPTIFQPSSTTVKRDAVIALLGDGSMRLLVPFPIKDQVSALAKDRQFEEANDLANLCPNEVSDQLKQRLVLLHANHLFEVGNYADVVAKLTAAKIDPRFMINFFPGYMPEVVRKRWTPPDDTIVQYKPTSFSSDATTLVIAYLEGFRSGRPTPTEHRPPIREATLDNASDVMCVMAAIDTAVMHALCDVGQDPGKLLRSPNYIVLEEARKKFLKMNDFTSLGLLYLSLRDWKELDSILRLLHRIAVMGSDDPSAQLPSVDIKGTPLNNLMRTLVDQNAVDASRYYELSEARRIVDRSTSGLKPDEKDVLVRQFMAVTITAFLLKELDGEQQEQEALVLQHSLWLLTSFPPAYATSIFVKETKRLQPKKVAEFLEPFPATCNEYLGRLMGPDVNSVTDDELHRYRVAALMKLLSDPTLQLSVQAQYTTELTDFLNKSVRYNLMEALRQLELLLTRDRNESLVRAQTIIYRKLGMHKEAVTLLLAANKPREAELYAREVSEESRRSGKQADAFRFLVDAMLRRQEGTPKQREADVLALIGRNPQMDAVAALEVLPPETKVADLKTFLINALRSSDAQARSQMIKANMLKSSLRSLDVVSAVTKSANVRLTRDSKCLVCSRAIGASIFLRFPDGTLAHHGCVQDKNVSPDTGRDFSRNVDLL